MSSGLMGFATHLDKFLLRHAILPLDCTMSNGHDVCHESGRRLLLLSVLRVLRRDPATLFGLAETYLECTCGPCIPSLNLPLWHPRVACLPLPGWDHILIVITALRPRDALRCGGSQVYLPPTTYGPIQMGGDRGHWGFQGFWLLRFMGLCLNF